MNLLIDKTPAPAPPVWMITKPTYGIREGASIGPAGVEASALRYGLGAKNRQEARLPAVLAQVREPRLVKEQRIITALGTPQGRNGYPRDMQMRQTRGSRPWYWRTCQPPAKREPRPPARARSSGHVPAMCGAPLD